MNEKEESLKTVFDAGIAGIHETNDVLARLFRMLVWQSNLPYVRWVTLLNKWVLKTQPRSNTDKAVRHTCGNLSKALKKHKISWKMFLKAVAIMEVDKMDLSVRFYRGDKTIDLSITMDNLLEIVLANDREDKERQEKQRRLTKKRSKTGEEEDESEFEE